MLRQVVRCPTWDEALDAIAEDPDAEPMHVVRFGSQLRAEGVLGGSPAAERCINYVGKYMHKGIGEVHEATTPGQQEHLQRSAMRPWRSSRDRPHSLRRPETGRQHTTQEEVMDHQPMGRLLKTDEVAERLRVDPSTLRRWRLDEVGPRFRRVGPHTYRYPVDELENWILESVRHSVVS